MDLRFTHPSMLTGLKQELPATIPAVATHPFVATIAILITLIFGGYLLQNFDVNRGTLNLFGTQLQLSEQENEAEHGVKNNGSDEDENEEKSKCRLAGQVLRSKA